MEIIKMEREKKGDCIASSSPAWLIKPLYDIVYHIKNIYSIVVRGVDVRLKVLFSFSLPWMQNKRQENDSVGWDGCMNYDR